MLCYTPCHGLESHQYLKKPQKWLRKISRCCSWSESEESIVHRRNMQARNPAWRWNLGQTFPEVRNMSTRDPTKRTHVHHNGKSDPIWSMFIPMENVTLYNHKLHLIRKSTSGQALGPQAVSKQPGRKCLFLKQRKTVPCLPTGSCWCTWQIISKRRSRKHPEEN